MQCLQYHEYIKKYSTTSQPTMLTRNKQFWVYVIMVTKFIVEYYHAYSYSMYHMYAWYMSYAIYTFTRIIITQYICMNIMPMLMCIYKVLLEHPTLSWYSWRAASPAVTSFLRFLLF